MTQRHTPTPWKATVFPNGNGISIDANDGKDPVGTVYLVGHQPEHQNDPVMRDLAQRCHANAAYIVRAVNAHEQLVKTLQHIASTDATIFSNQQRALRIVSNLAKRALEAAGIKAEG